MALPTFADGQEPQPPKIIGIRVGIADRYKAGAWTQVEVVLRGGDESLSGSVSIIVPDGDGTPGRTTTPPNRPCQLLPGRTQTVRLLTRFGRVHSDLTAVFQAPDHKPVTRTFSTAMQLEAGRFLPGIEFQKLVVVVGGSTLGVETVGKLGGSEPEYWPVAAGVSDIEQLPTQREGYDGVDVVVLSTARPEIYAKLAANNARVQALDEWVRLGGRLILCVGSAAEEILARDAPLARFAPGRLDKVVPLHQTGSLEAYAESRLSVSQSGERVEMQVPRLADVQGVVEADEAGLPLIVRTPRGFGQVIFVAADLEGSALAKWNDRPQLVAKLLDLPVKREESLQANTAISHYGYTDLAGHLRSSLDQFTGISLVPFWIVAGLIVIYILLIGPGDYFFLRKLIGRMEWTWVTFPVIVTAVCVAAYVLAYQLKGDQIRVHQIDLVDVDAASGRMRGAAWMNVFSPRMESFDLSIEPVLPDGRPAPDARAWLAWFGLQGTSLGGMNAHGGGDLLGGSTFQYAADLNGMHGVPIQVWSTKSLTARWESPAPACPKADLTEDDRLLSGSITNTFSFPLGNCILAYGRSAYELGTIEPGATVPLGTMSKRSELKTLLTGQKAVFAEGDKVNQTTTPFDQSSVDPAYILRAMFFYEAAGGRRYSQLWNDYQSFVDLSDLLKADRAILVAQEPVDSGDGRHAAELLRDGRPLDIRRDQHGTMYRFIFPVKKGK
jgi:hypothetical protein